MGSICGFFRNTLTQIRDEIRVAGESGFVTTKKGRMCSGSAER